MKRLLAILGSVAVVAAGSSTVVSCSARQFNQNYSKSLSNKYIQIIKKTDLGELNNLKPLSSKDDANTFNTDNTKTYAHKTFKTKDYANADNKIGTYEIAKVLFKKNRIRFDYTTLFGFEFKLEKDSSKTNGYKMTVRSDDGHEVVCYFTSTQDIQLSLNSVIDDTETLHVPDGNVRTIAKEAMKRSTDNSVQLDIYNRQNPNGVNSINIDSATGKGTIQLFDSTHKYGGFINLHIIIDNYQKAEWDSFGNVFNLYNDRTVAQNNAINDIDNNYKNTKLNKNKHVILFGFDGIRFDKFKELMEPHVNENYHTYGGYYSQPSESVYGWKTDLTGDVTGSATNIFDMVNNAKNSQDMVAMGNFNWKNYPKKVFAKHKEKGPKNIDKSFTKPGTYMYIEDHKDLWVNEVKKIMKDNPDAYAGVKLPKKIKGISDQQFKDIWNPTHDEIMFSKAKSQAIYNVTKDMYSNYKQEPNLVFNYDTEADDEGHAFDNEKQSSFDAFYKSDVLKETFKTYADELNDAYKNYGTNPNYLILEIVDHGRDSIDSGHNPFDPDARRGWMLSNNDHLENYISTKNKDDINQYSIKEIIWNFLKS